MTLTPDQCAALQAQLDDAKSQYHALITGTQARVVVDRNNERVEFTAANRSTLASYITGLESQINSCCGVTVPAMRPLGPAGFVF